MLRTGVLCLCAVAVMLAGCSTKKPKPKAEADKTHQRGWIGGGVEFAQKYNRWPGIPLPADPSLPNGLASSNHAGLLITALSSNTPAHEAGLRESDLILDVNHQPVTTMKAFRKTVDLAKPGTMLPVTAWREGKTFDCDVIVGRERYTRYVTFGFGLPFYGFPDLGRLDLWPNPGFSIGCLLGFEPAPYDREELWSAKGAYYRAAVGTNYTRGETDWNSWLLIFWSTEGKTIHSQERFSPTNAPSAASGGPAK